MSVKLTIADLWSRLDQHGFVDGAVPNLPEDEASSMPWYVSALVGIGGWVAAAFLMAFFAATNLIDNEQSMLILGSVLCVAALAIKYALRHAIFPGQLSFAISLAGQGLIIASQFDNQEILPIVITVLILEGLLFLLYPDALHRLISLAAMIGAVVALLIDWSLTQYIPWLTLLLATAGLGIWLGQHVMLAGRFAGWVGDFYAPLSIGLPLGAMGLCILQLTEMDIAKGQWWIVALGMAVLLLGLGVMVLTELGQSILSPTGIGVLLLVAALMIPGYETPGIMAGTLILGMAFWRRHRLMMGVGIIGFALFISFYYYNLDLTLLTKSLILMGSGIALLALRLLSNKLFGGIE